MAKVRSWAGLDVRAVMLIVAAADVLTGDAGCKLRRTLDREQLRP
jgi:hypothetical protein